MKHLVLAAVLAAAPVLAEPGVDMSNWRDVATDADRARLHDWRAAFVKALGEARADGHGGEVAKEGVLLSADAALPDPALPPGRYACRTIKVGDQGGDGLSFVAYRPFACTVTGTQFTKVNGSQRPSGRLFRPNDRRQVFLGTMALGDETRAIVYGRDPDRDMAGMVERIGPKRWRLILPYPRFESTLDVIELVPAS